MSGARINTRLAAAAKDYLELQWAQTEREGNAAALTANYYANGLSSSYGFAL